MTKIEVNQMIGKYLILEGFSIEEYKVNVLDFYGMSFVLTAHQVNIANMEESYSLDYVDPKCSETDDDNLLECLEEVLENVKYYKRLCNLVIKYGFGEFDEQ